MQVDRVSHLRKERPGQLLEFIPALTFQWLESLQWLAVAKDVISAHRADKNELGPRNSEPLA